jgi:hypothetical protein
MDEKSMDRLEVLKQALEILAHNPQTSHYVKTLRDVYDVWDERNRAGRAVMPKEELKEKLDRAEKRLREVHIKDAYDTLYVQFFLLCTAMFHKNFKGLPTEVLVMIGKQIAPRTRTSEAVMRQVLKEAREIWDEVQEE